jgi:hypothetical protein
MGRIQICNLTNMKNKTNTYLIGSGNIKRESNG